MFVLSASSFPFEYVFDITIEKGGLRSREILFCGLRDLFLGVVTHMRIYGTRNTSRPTTYGIMKNWAAIPETLVALDLPPSPSPFYSFTVIHVVGRSSAVYLVTAVVLWIKHLSWACSGMRQGERKKSKEKQRKETQKGAFYAKQLMVLMKKDSFLVSDHAKYRYLITCVSQSLQLWRKEQSQGTLTTHAQLANRSSIPSLITHTGPLPVHLQSILIVCTLSYPFALSPPRSFLPSFFFCCDVYPPVFPRWLVSPTVRDPRPTTHFLLPSSAFPATYTHIHTSPPP